ncbi:MAG: class IV adenylate cyclase [Planctomycetota bacterium]
MFEVEQKFPVDDADRLQAQLRQLAGGPGQRQDHRDTYFNHPCRDFAETTEALRIRMLDDRPMVTYKGAKLPDNEGNRDGIKARRELEWRLDPGDPDGSHFRELLTSLSFREVATVAKHREQFSFVPGVFVGVTLPVAVTLDRVEEVGIYAEIEIVAADDQAIGGARDQIALVARQLGLTDSEPRSYLRLLLGE